MTEKTCQCTDLTVNGDSYFGTPFNPDSQGIQNNPNRSKSVFYNDIVVKKQILYSDGSVMIDPKTQQANFDSQKSRLESAVGDDDNIYLSYDPDQKNSNIYIKALENVERNFDSKNHNYLVNALENVERKFTAKNHTKIARTMENALWDAQSKNRLWKINATEDNVFQHDSNNLSRISTTKENSLWDYKSKNRLWKINATEDNMFNYESNNLTQKSNTKNKVLYDLAAKDREYKYFAENLDTRVRDAKIIEDSWTGRDDITMDRTASQNLSINLQGANFNFNRGGSDSYTETVEFSKDQYLLQPFTVLNEDGIPKEVLMYVKK